MLNQSVVEPDVGLAVGVTATVPTPVLVETLYWPAAIYRYTNDETGVRLPEENSPRPDPSATAVGALPMKFHCIVSPGARTTRLGAIPASSTSAYPRFASG